MCILHVHRSNGKSLRNEARLGTILKPGNMPRHLDAFGYENEPIAKSNLVVSWNGGIPKKIIHFERWDFPWNSPSILRATPIFGRFWNPHPLRRCHSLGLSGISPSLRLVEASHLAAPTSRHVIFDHIWLVVGPPLWKIWVRQLGWLATQYMGK